MLRQTENTSSYTTDPLTHKPMGLGTKYNLRIYRILQINMSKRCHMQRNLCLRHIGVSYKAPTKVTNAVDFYS